MTFTDDQVMMCLAGLAYRGFADPGIGLMHERRVGQAVARGLETLPPLEQDWELVWGPATYRATGSLLDDACAFVVRRKSAPLRYVVAIRGTNPVSAFDWVFGDFWAGFGTPWPYGDGSARISLSCALGMAVMRNLEAVAPPSADAGDLFAHAAECEDAFRRATDGLLRDLERLVGPIVDAVRLKIAAGFRELLGLRARIADDAFATRVDAYAELWTSPLRATLLAVVAGVAPLLRGHLDLALLGLLEDGAALRAHVGDGVGLLAFLRAAVEQAEDAVDVVVAGHSKGGGLASTMALWLAETQGTQAPESDRWDPARRATVHCWSFAGPTAGNAAFAARSNQIIGPRCHRIVNALDVVPHAWAIADVGAIATLYDQGVVASIPGLTSLAKVVAAATSHLGYTQIGDHLTTLHGEIDPLKPTFVDQMVHQHMEAYLRLMQLAPAVTLGSFFDP